MSIKSGFYNSLNGDRKYDAQDMSAIFDGIINDGVFAVGEAFATKAASGNVVTVGTGRAWFNSTWIYNDASLSLAVPAIASSANDAVDLVVLEVDRSTAVRAATIKFVEQYAYTDTTITNTTERVTAAINAAIESKLTNTTEVHQYPLAAIYRASGTTDEVAQADITYLVGSTNCPMVTGILDVMDITNIVAQWDSQFTLWFASVKATLDDDVATSLTNKVASIESNITDITNGTTKVGDSSKLDGKSASEYAAASHKHKPSDISGSTEAEQYLASRVMASPTAVAEIDKSQVRNIYAGTEDMVAGETVLASGAIYIVYE